MIENVEVVIPYEREQNEFYCRTAEKIEEVGRAYRRGDSSPMFTAIASGECAILPGMVGFIVQRGATYGGEQGFFQAVGISHIRGGRATAFALIPVSQV